MPGLAAPSSAFRLPGLSGTWAQCAEGLRHPHTGEIRPVVFDPNLAAGRDDVVLAHLNHRLVGMCLRLLRAEIWSAEGKKKLHRLTARTLPDTVLREPAMIAHARLVVIGGDSHRLHEEIIAAGGLLTAGRFSRLNVGQVKEALDAAGDAEPSRHRAGRSAPHVRAAFGRTVCDFGGACHRPCQGAGKIPRRA